MKKVLILFLLLTLVSCSTTGVSETPVVLVNIESTPTDPVLPSPTAAPTIAATVTPTSAPSCDPSTADFCISEGHLILQRPIHAPANDRIDPFYGFGSTANGTREPHHGVEFENPSGTPVYAAAAGRVIFAAPDNKPVYSPWPDFYGNLVVIEHQDGLFTLYAHLSKIDVPAGQDVSAGQKIGEVGRTGGAIGSHLHFEVRQGSAEDYFSARNPVLWLLPAQAQNGSFYGTLMISVVDGEGNLVRKANFTIGYYSDPSQSPSQMYYVAPYSPDLLKGEENMAIGELSAGHYRIVAETNGQMLERWVEVESGRLTQVLFVVK